MKQASDDPSRQNDNDLVQRIRDHAQNLGSISEPLLDGLLDRIGGARVVLLGESTHGTSEFYDLRAAITKRLIEEKGFNIVGLEADWPDMESVNDYVHGRSEAWSGFARFPEWMWRNHQFKNFVEQLKDLNRSDSRAPVSVYGLDLYSLSSSLDAVVRFLEETNPEAAKGAREAKQCLHPWQFDPGRYGLSVWRQMTEGCQDKILDLLRQMHEQQTSSLKSPRELLSALQNARVAANAEEYYRVMYESSVESWNLRDRHMFETLLLLLDHHGTESKAIIWEHNSHLGNASATQMGLIGEINVGQLCRSKYGSGCYSIGFMTDTGTVAAASEWDGEMEIKNLRPTRSDSYESLFHQAASADCSSGINYFLPLRTASGDLKKELNRTRLERAVGVLYLPETERQSHYFRANLVDQFDEVCWVDETHAVKAMDHIEETSAPDLVPFGI